MGDRHMGVHFTILFTLEYVSKKNKILHNILMYEIFRLKNLPNMYKICVRKTTNSDEQNQRIK